MIRYFEAFHMATLGYDSVSTEREYLCAIRAHIRRSLDDPHPDLTGICKEGMMTAPSPAYDG